VSAVDDALVTESFGSLAQYRAAGGGAGIAEARRRSPASVIAEVRAAGLRGRGGAGFPTATKWAAVRAAAGPATAVVANAAEGEPGTFKDRFLLRRNPYQVLEGLAIAAYAVGAARTFVAIKEGYRREVAALRRAEEEMHCAGLIGPVQIVTGPDEYLFGEEKALLEVVEGGRPLPRILPPYQVGLVARRGARNPAVVNNVETLAHVTAVLRHGGAAFRARGAPESPGTMVVTLSGDVRRPGVHELPLGVPLRVLLDDIGGGAANGGRIKAVVPGASAGLLTADRFDTPLDVDSVREAGSGLGSAGLVAYDDSACIVAVTLAFARFLAVESCAQCPACKQGGAGIVESLDRIERGEGSRKDVDAVLAKCGTVTGGQRCFLPSGLALLVRSAFGAFEEEIDEHLGRSCPRPRDLPVPKIVDFDDAAGTFSYDEGYRRKRPDWTREPA
jgi:NADH-quinone oxidoreductase subunit F